MFKPRLLSTAITCVTLGLSGMAVHTAAETNRHTLDWVPLTALSEAQKAALAPGSCGAYIAPVREDAEAKLNPQAAPIKARAKQSSVYEQGDNPASKQVVLIGDVVVTQGYRQLKGQRAHLNQAEGTLAIEGELELREPGLLVLGDATLVNQQQSTLDVDNATYVLHQAAVRGSAERVVKGREETLTLEHASFTHCQPDNNTWLLKGSQIVLDRETRQGHAKHVRLLIKGVPVFYLPYLRFPLGKERLSGFLAPAYSRDEDAVNIAIPYYFNLAPHYDLLLTTHLLPQHGVLYDGEFRHLHRRFYTQLRTAYLFNDKGEVDEDDQSLIDSGSLSTAEAVPFKGEDRWLVNLDQSGTLSSRWTTDVHYTEVSDVDYVRDFEPNEIDDNDGAYLSQRLAANYRGQHWQGQVEALRYQVLNQNITLPYEALPSLTLDGDYTLGKGDNSYWDLAFNHEWTAFDHPDADAATPTLTGSRLRTDYGLGWHFEPQWGFFKPRLQVKHLQYKLNNNHFVDGADESPALTVPQGSVDAGLFFERDGQGYLQTFEPRLFYFYSDFEDHSPLFDLTTDGQDIDFDTSALSFSYSQLFRDTRFSGGDRIDDANQLAIGLTTRFYGNQSGREWFSASLGQINYFEDRRVTLSNSANSEQRSAIAGRLAARPGEDWLLSSDFLYDDEQHQLSQGNVKLRYQNDQQHFVGFNYRFVRGSSADTEQVDASIIAPLYRDRWHLFLYQQYDIEQGRELDTLSAIEYNGCCYRLRLGYRRELDSSLTNTIANSALEYDNSAFFELHFKGLGGTSKQLDSLLDENIDGYAQWQAIYHP